MRLCGTVPSEAPWTVPESQCTTFREQSTAPGADPGLEQSP
jgi:hypothetical protein